MSEGNIQDSVEKVVAKIRKEFGEESVFTLHSGEVTDIPVIPTGSATLDAAIGVGGYPKGRIIEIFGAESSGKTSLALVAVSQVQLAGGTAAYIDAENSLDPAYAQVLGVDVDNLLISQPDTAEDALNLLDYYVANSLVDIVVLDSVAALVPKVELEGNMGDAHMAIVARLMSQLMRKVKGNVRKSDCVAIFINQTRTKIGFGSTFGGGDGQDTTGGKALKFYSSVRLKVSRTGYEKKGDVPIGSQLKIQVVKNKVAPPFRVATPTLFYDRGFDEVFDSLDLWVKAGVVDKSGTWFSFGNIRLGQGRDKVSDFLNSNPDILSNIKKEFRLKGDAGNFLEIKTSVEDNVDIDTGFKGK